MKKDRNRTQAYSPGKVIIRSSLGVRYERRPLQVLVPLLYFFHTLNLLVILTDAVDAPAPTI